MTDRTRLEEASPASQAVRRAARAILDGGVIAYPTEGVWGLGCDPSKQDAVTKILSLKQRPVEKGLILVAGAQGQIRSFILDPPNFPETLVPTTWLVTHSGKLPIGLVAAAKKSLCD